MKTKLLALVSACALLTGCFDYSDGERAGTVIKLSRKGIFCKTWEGEMLLGGLKKKTNVSSDGKSVTTSMAANTWTFTIEDRDARLLPAIRAALDSGEPITLTYRQELVTFCRSDSDGYYFVTGIK